MPVSTSKTNRRKTRLKEKRPKSPHTLERKRGKKATSERTGSRDKPTTTSSISTDLVAYLRSKGKTLKQIGEMIGTGESFISRVGAGDRSFTLEHMEQFEQKLRKPIPVLLLESVWAKSIPASKKKAFNEALRLLEESAKIRSWLAE